MVEIQDVNIEQKVPKPISSKFGIRHYTKENPPYKVDKVVFKRHDGRIGPDALKFNLQADQAIANLDTNMPGQGRLEGAMLSAAWMMCMALGTNGGQSNSGLYSWNLLDNSDGPGIAQYHKLPRWDPARDGLSIQEVTQRVKEIAKFLGASLVGTGLVDERLGVIGM